MSLDKVKVTKQGYIILTQIRYKLPICPKRDFLAKLTVTTEYLLYCFMLQHFKKKYPQRTIHKTESCIILAQLGGSYLLKRELFGKVDQSYFALTIVSHHALSFQKNLRSVDHGNMIA